MTTVHLLAAPDWHKMFVPSVSLPELFLRGSLMYLLIFAFMRVFRRESGSLSTADLLVVVLVADAAQNGMASEYYSVSEGAVLVATIFAWNRTIDWLSFTYPAMRRVLSAPPLLLVENGRLKARNMRQELISRDELAGLLREQGIDDVADVEKCYLESDGQVSVIRASKNGDESPPKRRQAT